MKDLRQYLKESKLLESILDPLQEKLSNDIWDNNKLKKSVKVQLTKKIETFLKSFTSKPITNMFLLGSMTGYQYNDTSDIDVNCIIDLGDSRLKEVTEIMVEKLNEKPLPGTKHPVNYYLSKEIKTEWKRSGPIYDMIKDKWIVQPKKEEENTLVVNYRAVIEISRFFTSGLDIMLSEYETDSQAYNSYELFLKNAKTQDDKEDLKKLISFKLQEIIADIDSLSISKHLIKAFRKEAFEEEDSDIGYKISTKIIIEDTANNSINNLIYKYLEKLGYLTKIQKILDTRETWESKVEKK